MLTPVYVSPQVERALQDCELWRSLHARAFAILHNQEDAEDAVAEAKLRLVKKGDTVRDHASVRAWLSTVVRHVSLDCRRRKRNRKFEELPDVADRQPTPESRLAAEAEFNRVVLERISKRPLLHQQILRPFLVPFLQDGLDGEKMRCDRCRNWPAQCDACRGKHKRAIDGLCDDLSYQQIVDLKSMLNKRKGRSA